MTQLKKICATFALALSASYAFAGGLLTNTNQSISFLRNPARDAAIGIDGTYSNPAGVAFLGDGLHIGFNWQMVWQTRTINTTNSLFALGVNNNGATTKQYEGKAHVPFLPSLQGAYNKGRWSFQLNVGVIGGGGSCEFSNGLGSFESAVGQIAGALNAFGAEGYDAQYYMKGSQFYYGVTLGAAFKVNEHLSVYGGLRGIYGSASYKAKISDIMVKTANGTVPFNTFLDAAKTSVDNNLTLVNAGIAQLQPVIDLYGDNTPEAYLTQYKTLVATKAQLEGAKPQLSALDVYSQGVNLQSDQTGFGMAPIIGADYKIGNFNFAGRYEFRTHMSMKNESTLKEAMAIDAVNQFQDGTSVREDMPALLTLGAQWSVLPNVRINAGYHHYYDKQSVKYNNKQDKLKNGTNEYLGGIEYDPIDKLTISAGGQLTRYGLSDEYMSDLSFVTNSYSFGFGAKYQFNDRVAVQAAYFQTNYEHYKTETADATGSINDFTRTNRVIGVGVEVNL